MKKLFIFILCLTLFCGPGICAGAAGVPELMERTEIITSSAADKSEIALMESTGTWSAEICSNKELLSGYGLEVYEKLEETFCGESLPDISEGFWQLGTAVEKSWTGGISMEDYNAWYYGVYEDVYAAISAFCADHPEVFYVKAAMWMSHSYSYSGTTVYAAKLRYAVAAPEDWDSTEEMAEIPELKKILSDAADALAAATEDMPTVARLAYFENWLAAENDYNQAALAQQNSYPSYRPWCVVSGMLDGEEPVCEGYAKAFQLLCHRIGVPCITVSGEANGGRHMWNAVLLGDDWYFCDPTWDDPIYTNTGVTADFSRRSYFLSSVPSSHVPDVGTSLPSLSARGYFDSWSRDGGVILGGELNGGRLLVALYDEYGRMTDCGFGYSFDWLPGQKMLASPDFPADKVNNADHAARFVFQADGWTTAAAKLEF